MAMTDLCDPYGDSALSGTEDFRTFDPEPKS